MLTSSPTSTTTGNQSSQLIVEAAVVIVVCLRNPSEHVLLRLLLLFYFILQGVVVGYWVCQQAADGWWRVVVSTYSSCTPQNLIKVWLSSLSIRLTWLWPHSNASSADDRGCFDQNNYCKKLFSTHTQKKKNDLRLIALIERIQLNLSFTYVTHTFTHRQLLQKRNNLRPRSPTSIK